MLRVRGCAARSTRLWMELGVIQFLSKRCFDPTFYDVG